jgi:photosystem II stability/assembly factor-like uncharacterized protein
MPRFAALTLLVVLVAPAASHASTPIWRSNGPEGGIVLGFAIAPSATDTVYAGTAEGVFRSTDAGATWTRASGLLGPIQALAVDPNDAATVYVASLTGLIHKSTNGGISWTLLASLFAGFYSLAIDPQTPTTLYVSDGAVFKSTDGGITWIPAMTGIPVSR